MHSAIDFQVYGVVVFARSHHCLGEGFERGEVVNLGLQAVGAHKSKAVGIGIEHHDRHSDTLLAQHNALVGKGYGKVINPLVFQHRGNLVVAVSVARRLDHSDHFALGGHQRAVDVQVAYHLREVYLQNGGVALARQGVNYAVEARHRASLYEYCCLLNIVLGESFQKLVGREVEVVARIEQIFVGAYALANAHKAAQPSLGA